MSSITLVVLSGLGLGALYFLVASGLSMIYGLMHVVNLAHGVLLGLGSYAGYEIMRALGGEGAISTGRFVAACAAAIAVTMVAGAVIERVMIRPLYLRHIDQILVTVGVWLASVALFTGIWGSDPLPFPRPEWLLGNIHVLGASVPRDRILMIAIAAVVLGALLALLRYSRIGLIVRAGVENRAMVSALGVDVGKVFTGVFACGAGLAAAGGILASVYQGGVFPVQGPEFMIYAFIVVVVGGFGTIAGTALAAVLVGLVQQAGNYYLATGLGDIMVLALLAAILLARPAGLAGKAVA